MGLSRTFSRRLGLWLALAALLLQAALPAGYMARASAGEPLIVLCSQQGVLVAAENIDPALRAVLGGGQDNSSHHQQDPPCGFAALAAAATAPIAPALPAPAGQSLAVAQVLAANDPQAWRAGPPLQARGPPALA